MKSGWQKLKLGQISGFQGGSQPPKSTFVNALKEGYIRLLQIRDFKSDSKAVYIPEAKKNRICTEKDILIGRYGASVGQIHRGKSGAYNVALIKTIPDEKHIDRDFFYYYLTSPLFQEPLVSVADRSAQAGFSKKDIVNFSVPLPPLPEQKRIVAILDEAFAGIERAVANTEKNLANARELFETYLDSLFLSKNGWKKLHLEEVLSVQPRNGWSPPAKNHSSEGTPVLTLSSVTGFHFNPRKIKFTSADVDHSRHYWVQNGDFLITRSNTPELVGHVAVASDIGIPTIYPDLIMRMVPDSEKVLTKFLYFQLRTSVLRKEIKGRAQGANPTMKKVGKKAVQTLPIVLPPIPQQEMILSKIERIVEETLHLEEVYRRKLAALSELKQSLLQKAFSGELTAETIANETQRAVA